MPLQQAPLATAQSTPGSPPTPTVLIGITPSPSGALPLVNLLNSQPGTHVLHQCRPLLPWDTERSPHTMHARFDPIRRVRPDVVRIGDVAHFYLPYVDRLIEAFPSVRIFCLLPDEREVADSLLRWLSTLADSQPVNPWAADRAGLADTPWDATFPDHPVADLETAARRHATDYHNQVKTLEARHPNHIKTFTPRTLTQREALPELLDWATIPRHEQLLSQPTSTGGVPRPGRHV